MSPRVHILAHDASTWAFTGYTKVKNVVIGNRVFIGAGSIILPGVKIGNDVIGARSVVIKDIRENSIYVGNPAKFIMHTDVYIEGEKAKMTLENCFDRTFRKRKMFHRTIRNSLKKMAKKHETAFVK